MNKKLLFMKRDNMVMKKLLLSTLIAALVCLSQGIAGAADMPFEESDNAPVPSRAIDNARDMLHLYPSGDTVVLPALSREEDWHNGFFNASNSLDLTFFQKQVLIL